MCDKKNNVLFTETECLILSPDFKLLDKSKVLLKVPRQNNMYSFNLKNVVPSGGLTCLFAKAIIDESNLWHRRLGHVNFKTMNKLVRGNLVRGIENQINHKVKIIRCDNGTEFKNSEMNQFYEMKGIKREFSVARTPQQNGVAERKNRTLIEAARTMLVDSLLPTTFWAEAINTACYVQNRVLITKPHNKTPYELLIGRSPNLDFMRPFGCPVTILNTLDHLGKFEGKADEGFLVGYSVNSKAFRSNVNGSANMEQGKAYYHEIYLLTFLTSDSQGLKSSDDEFVDDVGKKNDVQTQKGDPRFDISKLDRSNARGASMKRGNCSQKKQGQEYVAQVYPEEGIDLMEMDVKSVFLYGTIKDEVYMCQPLGFEGSQFPKDSLDVIEFERDDALRKIPDELYGELTFILGLQTASTPTETNKALIKDEEAENVDVHLYRSMIGSLMYLTASRPDIMFVVCACARFQVTPKTSHLHVVKRIFRYLKGQPKLGLWYPRDSPFDLEAFSDSDYAGASLDRKSTIGGCQFLSKRLISWQCKKQTIVANSTTEAEYVALLIAVDSPTIYASYIEQFWNTATSKIVNSVKQIHAIVDGKAVVISESSVRSDLLFNDEDGTACLTNDEIFENLALMGYEQLSTKLTFQKAPEGEGSIIPPEPQPTPSTSQPNVSEPQTESLQTETPPIVSHEIQTEAHIKQILPSPSIYQRKQRKIQKHRRAKQVTALPQTSVPLDYGANEAVHKEGVTEIGSSDRPRLQDTTLGGADAQTRPETASKMSRDPPLSEVNTSGRGKDIMEYHDDLTDFVPPTPYDSPLLGGNTPGSDEGRMELIQELMETCTSLTKRVLALEEAKTT
ncbi:ribonuclease H-like domain-containing protein [Tanacetum coccineum]|uniref:Ribonuclease H-like domain-containing protein n=1 Tax=Tanacetum coccineum TaxID=301880 RepID=A0ABQ4ZPG7_9ASTR